MVKLSHLTKRRLQSFRNSRRGWWSLILFSTLFLLSTGAEFIAQRHPTARSLSKYVLHPDIHGLPGNNVWWRL